MTPPKLKTRATSAITKKLLADHERMSALVDALKPLLQEICRRQASADLKKAQGHIEQLILIMNTHAACEEEAVLPALTKYHPLLALEAEHDELLMKRAALLSGLMHYSFPEDCSDKLYNQAMEFFDLFERHMAKEEQTFFPLLEQSLSPEEKFMVLTQMENIRAKARAIPTPEISRPCASFTHFEFPMHEPMTQNIHFHSVLKKDDLQIKTLELKAGASLSKHCSPQRVILLLYTGNATWSASDTSLSLKAGDGILMDPQLMHALEAETDCRLLLIFNNL